MSKRFTAAATIVILSLALSGLFVAGCGGGGGGGDDASRSSNGLGGVSTTGNLTLRVSVGGGPPDVQVRGEEIHLLVGSSARNLDVELFRLPLASQSPLPDLSRSFQLVDGVNSVRIDEIPAPATYRVRGFFTDLTGLPLSNFQVDVEILPGQITFATVTASPTVSPSFSPTVTPTLQPGPRFTVAAGTISDVTMDMRSDGGFGVAWNNFSSAHIATYSAPPTPTPVAFATQVVTAGTGEFLSGATVTVDDANRLGLLWRSDSGPNSFLFARFFDFATGGALAPQVGVTSGTVANAIENLSFQMPNVGDPAATWSLATNREVMGAQVLIPSGPATPAGGQVLLGPNPQRGPNSMDRDEDGTTALVVENNATPPGVLTLILLDENLNVQQSQNVITNLDVEGRASVSIRNGRISVVFAKDSTGGTGGQIDTFLVQATYTPGNLTAPMTVGSPILIDQADTEFFQTPGNDVAMDPNGNAIVAWREYDTQPGSGASDIFARLVKPGGVLGTPFRVNDAIDGQAGENTMLPNVGMDDLGRYAVVWFQSNGGQFVFGRGYPALFTP